MSWDPYIYVRLVFDLAKLSEPFPRRVSSQSCGSFGLGHRGCSPKVTNSFTESSFWGHKFHQTTKDTPRRVPPSVNTSGTFTEAYFYRTRILSREGYLVHIRRVTNSIVVHDYIH
jgi:hypothetical protein